MSLYSSLPPGYDSLFNPPEPDCMFGVMGSDSEDYELPYREPVVLPETDRSRAWKKRLAELVKGIAR